MSRPALDFLLIDKSPWHQETLQRSLTSSLLILVLRPDYQDYQGTAVVVEVIHVIRQKISLIVNQALPQALTLKPI